MNKIFILLLVSLHALAQKKPLVFREVWVWEYLNEAGLPQEVAIYHLPEKNYWLFTAEAYGESEEAPEYILAKPDGEFLFAYAENELARKKVTLSGPKVLPPRYRLQKKTQLFSAPEVSSAKILGKLYLKLSDTSAEASEMFLTDTKSDMRPVYTFNSMNAGAKLPVSFPLDLPAHTHVLEEKNQGKTLFTFKYKSPATYYVYRY